LSQLIVVNGKCFNSIGVILWPFPEKVSLRLQEKTADFDQTCKPFKAGFLYLLNVIFLVSKKQMRKEVFHEACMAMLNEGFSHLF
jgi:hypothetical protein